MIWLWHLRLSQVTNRLQILRSFDRKVHQVYQHENGASNMLIMLQGFMTSSLKWDAWPSNGPFSATENGVSSSDSNMVEFLRISCAVQGNAGGHARVASQVGMKDEAALFYRPQWHQTLAALMGKKLLTHNFLLEPQELLSPLFPLGMHYFHYLPSGRIFALQLRTPPNTWSSWRTSSHRAFAQAETFCTDPLVNVYVLL